MYFNSSLIGFMRYSLIMIYGPMWVWRQIQNMKTTPSAQCACVGDRDLVEVEINARHETYDDARKEITSKELGKLYAVITFDKYHMSPTCGNISYC